MERVHIPYAEVDKLVAPEIAGPRVAWAGWRMAGIMVGRLPSTVGRWPVDSMPATCHIALVILPSCIRPARHWS